MRAPFQLFVFMGWWLGEFFVIDALVDVCPAIAVILAVLSFCLHGWSAAISCMGVCMRARKMVHEPDS